MTTYGNSIDAHLGELMRSGHISRRVREADDALAELVLVAERLHAAFSAADLTTNTERMIAGYVDRSRDSLRSMLDDRTRGTMAPDDARVAAERMAGALDDLLQLL